MSPADLAGRVLRDAVEPALATLAPLGVGGDARARRMLLAIAGQESGWTARCQANNGPAHGLWQFEKGGVLGVLTCRATVQIAARFCQARGVQPVVATVHAALEHDDVLAAGLARLLLFSDPLPLPNDAPSGWVYYVRNWRPGKPRPQDWSAVWHAADAALVPLAA